MKYGMSILLFTAADFRAAILISLTERSISFPMKRNITFKHFLQTISHNMDVLNAYELKLDVGVVVFIFISLPCCSVCHCVELKNIGKIR